MSTAENDLPGASAPAFPAAAAAGAAGAAQARAKALADEVDFWKTVVSDGGWRWPEEHREKLDPDRLLHWSCRKWIAAPHGSAVDILDVGAGPLTILGGRWPGRVVRITAVDPLAGQYDAVLAGQGIVPPVRTIAGDADGLVDQFGADRFDLVFCRNAMDHTLDPLSGIRNCLAVARPGRYVVLHHFTNEGEHQKYDQLHQWNFDKQEGRFVAWNPAARIVIDEAAADLCDEVYCEVEETRWIVVALRKRAGARDGAARA